MLELVITVFWLGLKLLVVALAILYVGLVLMSYRTDGPHYRPKLDSRDPARLVETLLIWLGVKALSAALNLGRSVFEMLSDTSAELGEWFIRRRSGEVREGFRSRFLL